MSRIVEHNGTTGKIVPSSYNTDHSYYNISNANRAYTNSSSSNYATVNMTRGAGMITYVYWEFSLPTIPSNAIISSITCNYRAGVSEKRVAIVENAYVQLCSSIAQV